MLFQIALREVKRMPEINSLVVMLAVGLFLVISAFVSILLSKLDSYFVISEYIEQKGICINAEYIQKQEKGQNILIRDADELKENLEGAQQVLSVSEVWDTYIAGTDIPATVWCYSPDLVDLLHPKMKEGTWFTEADTDAETLKAVLGSDIQGIHAGDKITIYSGLADKTVEVEVAGIIEDGATLYYQNSEQRARKDYRDCLYSYNSGQESALVILNDKQILYGAYASRFKDLNYRYDADLSGMQRQIKGSVIVTFKGNVSEQQINDRIDAMRSISMFHEVISLEKMKENSHRYIWSEWKKYVPVIVGLFILMLMFSVSINAVGMRKQLHNYAIYMICGLSSKEILRIRFWISGMDICAALFIVVGIRCLLYSTGAVSSFGVWQFIICCIISIIFMILAWCLTVLIVGRFTTCEILRRE